MRCFKKLFFVILTGISMNLFGQVHSIGIQVGANMTNVTATTSFHDSKFRTGIIGGLNYECLFKSNFSLSADLLYSQQGYKAIVAFTDETGDIVSDNTETKFYYDYLLLPIKFGYTVGQKLKGFAKIGLYPAILLKAEITIPKVDTDGNPTGYEVLNVKDKVTKFDLGGLLELGADYRVYNNLVIFTSATFRQSLTTFSNSQYYDESKMKHYGFALSLGIKYNLNNK
jgi:hypothetical protein